MVVVCVTIATRFHVVFVLVDHVVIVLLLMDLYTVIYDGSVEVPC